MNLSKQAHACAVSLQAEVDELMVVNCVAEKLNWRLLWVVVGAKTNTESGYLAIKNVNSVYHLDRCSTLSSSQCQLHFSFTHHEHTEAAFI